MGNERLIEFTSDRFGANYDLVAKAVIDVLSDAVNHPCHLPEDPDAPPTPPVAP
jgi:hypothetical protein